MPTAHNRILVTKDPVLADALDRVAALSQPKIPSAKLVRDLAIRGAEALLADRRREAAAVERLVARTTDTDPGYDRDVLLEIDQHAWSRK